MSSQGRRKGVPKTEQLSADAISKAASLAEDLRRQDVERQSIAAAAEEVGIPQEYLTRAAAAIQAETALRHATIARRRKIAAISTCVIVIVAAVQITIWRTLHVGDYPAATDLSATEPALSKPATVPSLPDISNSIPTVLLSIVPVFAEEPILACTHPLKIPLPEASLEIQNNFGQTVEAYEMDKEGSPQAKYKLLPGQKRKEPAVFGHPWLITDEQGNNLGLIFPQASPTRVRIPSQPELDKLRAMAHSGRQNQLNGFLTPSQSRPRPGATFTPSAASDRLESAIEFLNLSGERVELYRTDAKGTRSLINTLDPDANFAVRTYAGDYWAVVDQEHDVIATYKAEIIPRTAILWPR